MGYPNFMDTLSEESYENMAPEEPVLLEIEITDENGAELEPNSELTDAEEFIVTIESPEVVLVELVENQLNSNFNATDAKESLEAPESPEAVLIEIEENMESSFIEINTHLDDTIESSSVEINTNLDDSSNFIGTDADESLEFPESPEVVELESESELESENEY